MHGRLGQLSHPGNNNRHVKNDDNLQYCIVFAEITNFSK